MRFPAYILCVLLLLAQSTAAQSGTPRYQAYYYSQEAEDYIAAADYPAALKKLEKALALDGGNISYLTRKAQVYCLQLDYASAITLMKPVVKTRKCNPTGFQVYGNALDMAGKPDEAVEVYKTGLRKFPSTGSLYMELGITEYGRNNDSVALCWWREGIQMDDDFPSNYYWAAKVMAEQKYYLGALLNAEIFMSLDRQVSERSKEMSRLIYESYRKSFRLSSYNQPYFDFTSRGENLLLQQPSNADEAIEAACNYALEDTLHDLPITCLPAFRIAFREAWKTHFAGKFYYPLADWETQLAADSHQTAYTWWLLYDASPDEFMTWYNAHEAEYDAFEIWFIRKPLSLYLHSPPRKQ
jgi:tetratricopeptide (TPR) repeat protein